MINGIIGIHVDIDAIYVIGQIILFYDVLDKVKIDLLRGKILEIPLLIYRYSSEHFRKSIFAFNLTEYFSDDVNFVLYLVHFTHLSKLS